MRFPVVDKESGCRLSVELLKGAISSRQYAIPSANLSNFTVSARESEMILQIAKARCTCEFISITTDWAPEFDQIESWAETFNSRKG